MAKLYLKFETNTLKQYRMANTMRRHIKHPIGEDNLNSIAFSLEHGP